MEGILSALLISGDGRQAVYFWLMQAVLSTSDFPTCLFVLMCVYLAGRRRMYR